MKIRSKMILFYYKLPDALEILSISPVQRSVRSQRRQLELRTAKCKVLMAMGAVQWVASTVQAATIKWHSTRMVTLRSRTTLPHSHCANASLRQLVTLGA